MRSTRIAGAVVEGVGAGEWGDDERQSGCGQISPEIGITSTPVIDRTMGAHGTIFVVAMSKDSGGEVSPAAACAGCDDGRGVVGEPDGDCGNVSRDGRWQQRGQRSVCAGTVCGAGGAAADELDDLSGVDVALRCGPYTGWVMGYSESTLQQTSILNLTPNGSEGSIWMAGDGMQADGAGNIYFLDANGTLDAKDTVTGFPVNGDYGNAMMKLSTTGNTLAVDDFFETYDSINESNADTDLGSGGACCCRTWWMRRAWCGT